MAQVAVRWTPRQKTKAELREEDEKALFAAVMADDVTSIRLMLKRGVSLEARNGSGLTPYRCAPALLSFPSCSLVLSFVNFYATSMCHNEGIVRSRVRSLVLHFGCFHLLW